MLASNTRLISTAPHTAQQAEAHYLRLRSV